MLKNLFKKCQCAAVNEIQSIQKTSIKKMVIISLQDVIGQLLNDLDKYHRCFFPVLQCLHIVTNNLPRYPLGKKVM